MDSFTADECFFQHRVIHSTQSVVRAVDHKNITLTVEVNATDYLVTVVVSVNEWYIFGIS